MDSAPAASDPALPRVGMRLAPKLHERANQSIPIMFGVFLGPLMLALWGLLGIAATFVLVSRLCDRVAAGRP